MIIYAIIILCKKMWGDNMNQREIDILMLEENFRDKLENDLVSKQMPNKRVSIIDIKLVGNVNWKDKVSGKLVSENVFIVEKEIIEIDEDGNERKTLQDSCYLGDKCIGGRIGDGEIIYNPSFEISEPDKIIALKELFDRVSQEEIDNNSLNALQRKEMAEVLSAHFGREVSEEEVDELLKDFEEEELESDDGEEIDQGNYKKEENELSDKKAEKIKVNAIQRVDLNKLVDGKETLKKRLDLDCDYLHVIPSEHVKAIVPGIKINNTTYSLVGTKKGGESKVLNDEFEMDKAVGNSASKESTKLKADGTATRDNNDLSVYTRKSNGASIGCENNKGNVDMYFYQPKTSGENENVGIQVETSKTRAVPIESRNIMNRSNGTRRKEEVQNEVEEHTEEGCTPNLVEDFDGIEDTSSHEHLSEDIIDRFVEDILNYENNRGEELIRETFTEDEVKDKFLRELQKNNNEHLSIEQIVENVQEEMNQDAEFIKMHRR